MKPAAKGMWGYGAVVQDADGEGPHGIVVNSSAPGRFSDPDGFVWEAADGVA